MGVQFRWHSGETDIVPTGQGPQSRRRLGRWAAVIGLLLIVVAAAGGAVYWQSRQGLRAAQADLQQLIDAEIAALRSGRRETFLALLDRRYRPWLRYHEESFDRQAAWYAAYPEFRVRIESVTLGTETAIARVRLCDGQGGQAAEIAQWYFRRVNGQWRHAPPVSEFWGQEETSLRTSHITLEVQAPDRAAAPRLLSEMEELWNDLVRTYRLQQPGGPHASTPESGPRRLSIRIAPYGSPGTTSAVPSPHLALDAWSPEGRYALMARGARMAVARHILTGLLRRPNPKGATAWLIEGLALWHARAWEPQWLGLVQRSLRDGACAGLIESAGSGAGPRPAGGEASPRSDEHRRALAYTFGEFLGTSYAPTERRTLLQATEFSGSLHDASAAVLGQSITALEEAWLCHLQQHYASRG